MAYLLDADVFINTKKITTDLISALHFGIGSL